MGRLFALAASVAAALLLAWLGERTPDPAPRGAPPADFAAARAMADVEVMARAPHPIGSPENARVRDHLLARLAALGLDAQVQASDAVTRRAVGDEIYIGGGRVENVIGVLPGRDRTAPALALMAHYDSVPGSPGAADDAAGVAAALEIARAIKTGGQPARDVVLLITDGEEAGLLGAQAFFRDHPMARRLGFVINLETRGNGGRAQMFQTAPQNGEVIGLFKRTAVDPTSSSLTVFLYEQMPNDTDFTVSKDAGVPGLNYAFIGRQFDYHSASSTPANLDQGSLQHLGDQALSAAREIAFADALPGKAPDVVYSTTFGGHILSYPPGAGWAALLLAALLIAVGVAQARGKGFSKLDVLKGMGAALYLIALGVAVLRLARRATGAEFGFMEQRVLLAQAPRWEVALLILSLGVMIFAAACVGRGRTRLGAGLLALVAGLAASLFGGWDPISAGAGAAGALLAAASFGRPAGVPGAWTGVLLTGLIIGVALQIVAAPAAFLVAWPLALAALVAAATALGSRPGPVALVAWTVSGALGVGWILGFGHGVYLGLDMPELLAVIAWLTALLLWPLAHPPEHGKNALSLGLALLLLGLIVTAIVRFDPPWSERHPQATSITYFVDLDGQRSLLVSPTSDVTAWTRSALTAGGATISRQKLPIGWRREVQTAPAMAVAAPPPAIAFTGETEEKTILLAPPPGARTLYLDLKPTTALSAVAINGQPTDMLGKAGQWTRIRWHAAGPQGVRITYRSARPGAVEARFAALTPAWPSDAPPLPARPKDVMAFDTSDSTIVAASRRFTW